MPTGGRWSDSGRQGEPPCGGSCARDVRGAGSDSDSPPRPSLEVAAVQLKRDAGAAGAESYFDDAHPEFLVGLVVHWLLWGYAPRPVALAYDFGGVALLAAEGFLG